ncbi:MAG: glycosyltransferase [Mobilitalea sp.]
MQDPFATQHYYLTKYPKSELIDFQTKVFCKADKIIVTASIAKELKNTGNQIVIQKIKVLNFPIIEKMRRNITSREEDVLFNRFYINCVYVGKFNEETRNPQVLFQIFEQLKYDNIRLHIIGENKEKWNTYLSEEDSNIYFYGPKSKEISYNAELDSNILINLGNSVNNQLPSKLLEYISIGKPIVNLYKRGDCPTLEHMEKYPIGLNLMESRSEQEENIWKLLYFCKRYKNININYTYIRNKYFDCTVEYVSNEFLNVCNELLNEEKNPDEK